MDHKKSRGNFGGTLGFILAAAGSAVGLGNIWRFPYLAARDGGGLFVFCYIILALTFGFTLLTTEIAIGRKTGQSQLSAYKQIDSRFGFTGIFASVVPAIILPYYCAIGGWVLKYMVSYLTGGGTEAATDGYFTGFITANVSPIVYLIIFLAACAFIIYSGVEKGIERYSKVLMPILAILVVAIAIFSLTLSADDGNGNVRTGMQGLAFYLIPNFEGLTISKFLSVLMDALGQLFYSISVAMGIMVTYGSYAKKETDLMQSINSIEIFDTIIAMIAGVMIVPAVFVFMGPEGMSAGPGLMFVSLPKVFVAMGSIGVVIGAVFFVMVLFAALTSAVSIYEAIVSSLIDEFHLKRSNATLFTGIYALILGVIVCFGYNVLYFEYTLPNGAVAQILDIMDYVSNNVLMPVVALLTCILIGWVAGPKTVIDEITYGGKEFGHREGLYVVMIRIVAPILLVILLLQGIGLL